MKVYETDEDGNVLFHSDTYLGEDYISSNLKHWKYIKKEKVNGRWVYYYQDDISANLKKEGDQAVSDYYKATSKYNKAKQEEDRARSDFNSGKYMDEYQKDSQALKEKYKINWYDSKKTKEYKKLMQQLNPITYNKRAYKDLASKEGASSSAAYEKNKAYEKVKNISNKQKKNAGLGPSIERAVAKTAVKTLNAASNAISNGKKLFKKLFK